jgi:hypothetical protein
MKLTFLLSAKNVMPHIVTLDLKIFKQESHAVFFIYNSIRTIQKSAPLLHKVVLRYKIIAVCNI